MRLTFRRLLAYLDGVLEEEDVEIVGQKISESKVASQLIHRIRNAKTRIRLGAPRLNGTGMGLDPNTVAEYLDYTLEEERVPDFETVCFESDVHLAEVSASHEILTLVLAEPAQVERSIRERMYNLPQEVSDGRRAAPGTGSSHAGGRLDPAHPPTPSGDSEAPSDSDAGQEASAMREMAEYLDERNEVRWRSLLVTTALSFLLVIVGLRAIGKFDGSHPLLGKLLASNTTENPDPNLGDGGIPVLELEGLGTPVDGDNETSSDTAPTEETRGPSEPVVPTIESGAPPVPPTLDRETVGEPGDEPPPPSPVPSGPAPGELVEPAVSEPVAPPAPLVDDVAGKEGGEGNSPMPAAPALGPGETVAPPLIASLPPAETSDPSVDPVAPAVAGVPAPVLDVGLFNMPDQVLGRYSAADKTWRRLAGRDVIRSGDELRVPPFYRPQIALAGSLQMTIVGPAQLQVLAPVDGRPHIKLKYGRLIIETVATPNVSARVDLGSLMGDVLFKSADSAVAVATKGFLPVGKDPRTEVRQASQWAALRGVVLWVHNGDRNTPGIPLALGETLTAWDDQLGAPETKPVPPWVAATRTLGALALAAEEAEKEFTPERAMSLTLEELFNHRMVDVRSTATQSLVYFGDFVPFVKSLKVSNREENPDHVYRQHEYDAMRDVLGQGASAAEKLRLTLSQEFEGDADVMERVYALCCGFNNTQLEGGQATKLIEDLSNEEQAIRVLALENLRRITGKMKTYNPLKPPKTQLKGIASWSKLLEAGEVKWQTTPSPFE